MLGARDLEHYVFKALTTHGTLEDFKHFLPRVLELAAWGDTVGGSDLEIVLGKLAYGRWAKWPQQEREAVGRFLRALWEHVLGTFPCTPNADACLCGIGGAQDDLQPFLDEWRGEEAIPALRHLAEFIENNARSVLKDGRLGNAFWGRREEPMRQVIEWLLAPETEQKLERAFFGCTDPEVAGEISGAAEQLAWLRRRRGVTDAGPRGASEGRP